MSQVNFTLNVLLPDSIVSNGEELFCEDILKGLEIKLATGNISSGLIRLKYWSDNSVNEDVIIDRKIKYSTEFIKQHYIGRKFIKEAYWDKLVGVIKIQTDILIYEFSSDKLPRLMNPNKIQINSFIDNERINFCAMCEGIELKTAIEKYDIID